MLALTNIIINKLSLRVGSFRASSNSVSIIGSSIALYNSLGVKFYSLYSRFIL